VSVDVPFTVVMKVFPEYCNSINFCFILNRIRLWAIYYGRKPTL